MYWPTPGASSRYHGIVTEQETGIDAFTDRVKADLDSDPVLISGPHLAVWASKP
jgi:hypothetical protein